MVMLTGGDMARYPGVTIETFVIAIARQYLRVMPGWRTVSMGLIVMAGLLRPGGLVELADTVLGYARHRGQGSTAEPGAPVEPTDS